MWYVYLLECNDRSYYCGYTQDVDLRVCRHNQGRGAVYTACRKPVKLVWQESHDTEQSALKRERQIKGWSRVKKKALINGDMEFLCL